MSSLLNSLLPEYFKPKTNLNINSSRVQYGFNARIDMQYEDDSGTRKGSRPNAFMSNTVAFIGNYEGIIVDDIPILDGLRADIFDTHGDLDMGLVEDALSKSTMIRRNVPTYTAYASELLYKRNLTSLFYNMLRLYYIKKWGSIKYEKDAIFYDNGHACLLNRQLFPKSRDASLESSLSLPEAEIALLDPGLEFPEEDVPAILWHGRVSSRATCILGQACSEFAPLAPFSIAHYSPQLTRKLYVNAPAGIEPSSGRYTHEDVKDAITILVSANQAYTDFEAAYLMLAQTLVSPVPRTAEASAWFINAGMVNMPTLSCANGYYPALTNVNPYHRLDTWKDTLNHWVAYPDMLFYHSVAMIESCYVELGNVARVSDSDAINKYTFTELSVQGRPVMNRGIIVDLTLVAMRTGREISLPYPVSCGLTRTDALLQGTEIHVPVVVKDIDMPQYYNAIDKDVIEGQETVIKVKQLPPAMYPIYTYGINTTEFYSDHFEDQVQVEMAPIDNGKAVFNDARKFSKFMSIMRMMGNDVTATDLVTGRKVSNWADNSSGRFLYTDVKYEGQTAFLVDMDTVKARDHCWVSIVDPNGTMNLSYKMTNFRAAMFSRNKPLYMTGGSVRTIATGNYRDAAERLRAMDETLRLKPFKITEKLDFRVAAYAIPSLSGSNMPSSHHQEQLQISEVDAEPINPIGEDELPPDIE